MRSPPGSAGRPAPLKRERVAGQGPPQPPGLGLRSFLFLVRPPPGRPPGLAAVTAASGPGSARLGSLAGLEVAWWLLPAHTQTIKAATAWATRRAGGAWPGRLWDCERARPESPSPSPCLPFGFSAGARDRWPGGPREPRPHSAANRDGIERQVLSFRPCAAAGQTTWLGRSHGDIWPGFCDPGSASKLGSSQTAAAHRLRAAATWASRQGSMA